MDNMTVAARHKHGDTFLFLVEVTQGGAPKNLSSFTISSSVKQFEGEFSAPLSIAEPDLASGAFKLFAQTADWPLGTMIWDIQFSDGVSVFSSSTYGVIVCEDVTA